MKKIIYSTMILIIGLLMTGCSDNKGKSESSIKKIDSAQSTKVSDYKSPITDEYITDLDKLGSKPWESDATYFGKMVKNIKDLKWEKKETLEHFIQYTPAKHLVFATVKDNFITNARVFEKKSVDDNGFFELQRVQIIVSESYLNGTVKEADRKSFSEFDSKDVAHLNPNEKYFISGTYAKPKSNSHMRFFLKNDQLIREDRIKANELNLLRYKMSTAG